MDKSRASSELFSAASLETLSVHWRGLDVWFGDVRALAPCSGDVEAGQVVAIMGPSGAGKSTLLNALCKRGPKTNGEVYYSTGAKGSPRPLAWSKSLKKVVAFVEQDDHALANLTVRETLFFSARLRLPAASASEKMARVEDVVALLRLDSVKDAKVGSALARGISGGERKRLMVAQEILTEPKLLALDEPTSGLDSTVAVVVVEAIRDLAAKKRVAVAASVHQPSSRLFLMFDSLVLLDKHGTVYRGPTADAADAFAEAPFHLPCPAAFSAPDWLLEIVVGGDLGALDDDDDHDRDDEDDIENGVAFGSETKKSKGEDHLATGRDAGGIDSKDSEDVETGGSSGSGVPVGVSTRVTLEPGEAAEAAATTDRASSRKTETDEDDGGRGPTKSKPVVGKRALRAEIERRYGVASASPRPASRPLARVRSVRPSHDYDVPFSEQCRVLFLRTWLEVRPLVLDRNSVALHVGNATLAGLMWFRLPYTEAAVWPRITLAFAIPLTWVFYPLTSSLTVVPTHEVTLKRELSTNSYMLSAWYFVTTTTLLVPMFAQSFIHVALVFALTNLGPPLIWLTVYANVVLSLLTFQSIGLFFSAAVPAKNLMTAAMLYVTFCFLFTGIFVPLDASPLPWLGLANPMLYITSLGLHAVFGLNDRRYKCGNNVDDEGTDYPRSCDEDGDGKIAPVEIFKEYNFRALTPSASVGALIAFLVVTRGLALYILKRRMAAHLKAMSAYDRD